MYVIGFFFFPLNKYPPLQSIEQFGISQAASCSIRADTVPQHVVGEHSRIWHGFSIPPQTCRGILLLQRNSLRYGSFHDFVDDLVPTWERFSMSLQFSYNFDDVFGWFSYNFPWFSNNFDDVFMIQHFPACLSTNCQTSSRPQLAALNSPRWITVRGIGFPPHGSNLTLAKATWHSIYQVVAVSNIFVIFTPKIGEDEPNLTSIIFFKWVETTN